MHPDPPGTTERLTDRWLRAATWACPAVLIVGAVTQPSLLPLLDWPQQVLQLSLWHDLLRQEPTTLFWYRAEARVTTYQAVWWAALPMVPWLGAEGALRILLAAGLVALPLEAGRLMQRLGGSAWWGLTLLPLVWSHAFWMGFVPFVLGLPLMFRAWSMALDMCRAPRPGRILGLAGLTLLLFFVHSMVWMFTMALMAPLAALHAGLRWRTWLAGLTAVVPSVGCWGLWTLQTYALPTADLLGASVATLYDIRTLGEGAIGASSESLPVRVAAMPGLLFHGPTGPSAEALGKAILPVLLGVTMAGWLVALVERQRPAMAAGRLWAALLVAGAAMVPWDLAGVYAVGQRFAVVFATGMLILLAPPMPRRPGLRLALVAPPVILSGLLAVQAWRTADAFSQEQAGLLQAIEAIPRGSAVYGAVSGGSRHVRPPVLLHAGALAVARRGGALGFTFFNNLSLPIRVRVPGSLPWPGVRGEWETGRLHEQLYGRFYDVMLTHGLSGDLNRRLQAPAGTWVRLGSWDGWSVWQRARHERRAVLWSAQENAHRASVTMQPAGNPALPCPSDARGRHTCPGPEWMWAGPTQPHIDGQSQPCLWTHPLAGGVMAWSWPWPSGEATALTGFSALADSAFQGGAWQGADLRLRVWADERLLVEHLQPTRPGVIPLDVALDATAGGSPERLRVTVEGPEDGRRHFCWELRLLGPEGSRPGPDGVIQRPR